MKTLFAKFNSISLEYHTIGILKGCIDIVESLNIQDSLIKNKIIYSLILASVYQSVGKSTDYFQEKIKKEHNNSVNMKEFRKSKKKQRKDIKPHHHEISYAFFTKYIKIDDRLIYDTAKYALAWLLPPHTDKSNKIILFDNYEKIFNELSKDENDFEIKLEEYHKAILILVKSQDFMQKYLDIFEREELHSSPFFPEYHIKVDDSENTESLKIFCLKILQESYRFVNTLDRDSLSNYLKSSSNIFLTNRNNSKRFNFKNINPSDIRTLNQFELIKQAMKYKTSLFGLNPASGKTLIALAVFMLNSNERNRNLFVALPKQAQIKGSENTIKKALEILLENINSVSVELFFNGKVQKSINENKFNKDKELHSDINILTFDRLLSICYEMRQQSEFFLMLNNDLIIDELHEFIHLEAMCPSLKVILKIRSWINNGTKTILMTGTPDPALIRFLFGDLNKIPDFKYFDSNMLKPFNESKSYIEYNENFNDKIKKDSLISFNSIKKCQEYIVNRVSNFKNYQMLHSKYTEKDKDKNLKMILDSHSNKKSDKISVFCRIFNSCFDLNASNGYFENSLPNFIMQQIGRVNRFGNKPDGKILIFKDLDEEVFADDKLGYSSIHRKWDSFLKENFSAPKYMTISEFRTQIYDKFYNDSENVNMLQEILENRIYEANEALKSWFPSMNDLIYYKHLRKKNNKPYIKSLRKGFRGISKYLSAAIYNNLGNCISQLSNEDLLTINKSSWEFNHLIAACASLSKSDLNILKRINVEFNYKSLSHNVLGVYPDCPLLTSIYVDKNGKNRLLNKRLNDKKIKLYKIYNSYFGLISYSLYKKSLNRLSKV